MQIEQLSMVGDIYQYTYTYRQTRVYLTVHLAAIASIDSKNCGVGCTDRRVCSLVTGLCPSIGALQVPDSPAT